MKVLFNKMTYIYSLNDINEIPFYIGKSKNVKTRVATHLCNTKTNKSSYADFPYAFNYEILDKVPDEESQFWEYHYMSLYKSFGFNLKNRNYGKYKNVHI